MKISTDNGPIRNRFGDMRAVEMIAAAGFDGIDYTFYEIDPHNDILALPIRTRDVLIEQIRDCAQENNVTVVQAHAPFDYHAGESKDSKSYQDVLRSMDFAAALGCRQIVIHTLKFQPGDERAEDVNREFLLGFLPYADALNLDIGVENLFVYDEKCRCFRGQHALPQQMNAFIDSLGSPRFKVCCDLGHAAITGVEPQTFIRGMSAQRMTMLHVHDTDYRSDMHTLPYQGRQNWNAITKALAEIGFSGSMNLEVCGYYSAFPMEMIPAALRMAAQTARHLAGLVEAAL